MRETVAENDTLEIVRDIKDARPFYLHHIRMACDQKAALLISLCQTWGYGAAMGDAVANMAPGAGGAGPPKTIDFVVERAAEMVERIWEEGQRRGWIIAVPAYDSHLDDE